MLFFLLLFCSPVISSGPVLTPPVDYVSIHKYISVPTGTVLQTCVTFVAILWMPMWVEVLVMDISQRKPIKGAGRERWEGRVTEKHKVIDCSSYRAHSTTATSTFTNPCSTITLPTVLSSSAKVCWVILLCLALQWLLKLALNVGLLQESLTNPSSICSPRTLYLTTKQSGAQLSIYLQYPMEDDLLYGSWENKPLNAVQNIFSRPNPNPFCHCADALSHCAVLKPNTDGAYPLHVYSPPSFLLSFLSFLLKRW